MPSPEVHSPYGPSQAHAWLNCPQYVKVQAMFPETTSSYAEAGRLAHSIAEYKARTYFREPVGKRAYNAQLKKFQADPSYDPSMEGATELYLETLKELALSFPEKPFVALEAPVNYSDWVPEGFGTSDCLMIGPKRIVVVDYKNGAGVPVEAEHNEQMMLYALGALQTYRAIYGDTLTEATLVIVQPYAGGVKRWDTTVDFLLQWGADVAGPAAQRSRSASEPACAGDWCRFCAGKPKCTAWASKMLQVGRQYQQAPPAGSKQIPEAYSGPLLTDEEVGAALAAGAGLVAWYERLEAYALQACLDGRDIPGYKAVEGRGSRAWADLDKAFETLQSRGIDAALLWERKPVTVPGLEKALGKQTFTDIASDLVQKQPGKPALAPISDKRPPYDPAKAVFTAVEVR